MELKSFQEYLEERLDEDTIAKIEEQALRDVRILKQLHKKSSRQDKNPETTA